MNFHFLACEIFQFYLEAAYPLLYCFSRQAAQPA
jgi:hypothetical protein